MFTALLILSTTLFTIHLNFNPYCTEPSASYRAVSVKCHYHAVTGAGKGTRDGAPTKLLTNKSIKNLHIVINTLAVIYMISDDICVSLLFFCVIVIIVIVIVVVVVVVVVI